MNAFEYNQPMFWAILATDPADAAGAILLMGAVRPTSAPDEETAIREGMRFLEEREPGKFDSWQKAAVLLRWGRRDLLDHDLRDTMLKLGAPAEELSALVQQFRREIRESLLRARGKS